MSRYEIVIGNSKKSIEIERIQDALGQESYACKILGNEPKESRIIIQKRSPDVLIISIDDKMYSLRQTKRSQTSVDFRANGRKIHAHMPREGIMEETGKTGVASINELVTSNFPAKVVSVKSSVGAKLKEGETLLVLEAMKMEAQIKAPSDCDVVEIFVHEGEIVPRGAKLIRLKFGK